MRLRESSKKEEVQVFEKTRLPIIRVIFLTILALTVISAQAWAAGSSEGSGEKVTLVFWEGFNGPEVASLSDMIAKYWAPTHPNITINHEGGKNNDAMLTAMAGGTPPDIIMAPSSEVVTLWAQQGAIMDLTSAIAPFKAELESANVKAGLQWCLYKGKYYAVPFVNYNWGVFYNKALFKDAGLDPEKPPKTADELRAFARKLTKTDDKGAIMQLGWMPINDVWRALNFVLNFGGKFYDAKTQLPTAADERIIQAFAWDLALAKELGLQKIASFTSGFTEGDNPFVLGKVAMYVDGCWQPNFFKTSAPQLDYGVAAIPCSGPSFANSNDVGTNPIVVPTGSRHPKEAGEFVKFLTLNKDLAREFSSVISNLPQLKSELASFTKDPRTRFFADLSNSPNAVAWAPVPYSQQYLDALIVTIGQMYNEGVAPEKALAALQAQMLEVAKTAVK
jgi:multiple sugar transport system substrate-binding protein